MLTFSLTLSPFSIRFIRCQYRGRRILVYFLDDLAGAWYGIFGHGLFGSIYRVSFDGIAVVRTCVICILSYCVATIQPVRGKMVTAASVNYDGALAGLRRHGREVS